VVCRTPDIDDDVSRVGISRWQSPAHTQRNALLRRRGASPARPEFVCGEWRGSSYSRNLAVVKLMETAFFSALVPFPLRLEMFRGKTGAPVSGSLP